MEPILSSAFTLDLESSSDQQAYLGGHLVSWQLDDKLGLWGEEAWSTKVRTADCCARVLAHDGCVDVTLGGMASGWGLCCKIQKGLGLRLCLTASAGGGSPFWCACAHVCTRHVCGRQSTICGCSCLLPMCELQVSHLGHQGWLRVPLPTESSS